MAKQLQKPQQRTRERLKLPTKTRETPDPMEKTWKKLSASVSYEHLTKDSELSYLRNCDHSRVNWFDTQTKINVTAHHKLHHNQNLNLGQELSFVVIKKNKTQINTQKIQRSNQNHEEGSLI